MAKLKFKVGKIDIDLDTEYNEDLCILIRDRIVEMFDKMKADSGENNNVVMAYMCIDLVDQLLKSQREMEEKDRHIENLQLELENFKDSEKHLDQLIERVDSKLSDSF